MVELKDSSMVDYLVLWRVFQKVVMTADYLGLQKVI